ncbi:hypothetical protein P4S95_23495 [Aneurinibacillus aneurinilyticus]|uniref:hypothetical protein n=1 Tax=Aneurinibacillus aneurinilyticus TaxID=1391 RepID=UPI002E225287|nr:hypothetical protein [Aneurinibacillus aneurinilyticus]
MPIVQLNSVGYDTTQDLRRLIDKYNENFRQLDWLLNQKKLDGQNLSPQFYETIVESPDIIDAIQKAIEAALASLGTASIQSLNLNDAYIGVPYSQILSVPTNEAAIWEIVDGDLPLGIELAETGELMGTPTGPLDENGIPFPIPDDMYKVSSHMFAVYAATSTAQYFGVFYIDLCRKPGTGAGNGGIEKDPFRVVNLPSGIQGVYYKWTIQFSYGNNQKIKSVTVTSGKLPTGISIGFNNGKIGEIILNGRPTGEPDYVSFNYPFTINVLVEDSVTKETKTYSQSYEITINRISTNTEIPKMSKISISELACTITFENGNNRTLFFSRDGLGRINKITSDPGDQFFGRELIIEYPEMEHG